MVANLELPSLPFLLSEIFSPLSSHHVPAVPKASVDDGVNDAPSTSLLLPFLCNDGGDCDVDGDDGGSTSIARPAAFSRPRYLAHLAFHQPPLHRPLHLFPVASPPRNVVLFLSLISSLEGKRSRLRCLFQLLWPFGAVSGGPTRPSNVYVVLCLFHASYAIFHLELAFSA